MVVVRIRPKATRLTIDYWNLADLFPAIADAERKQNPSRKIIEIGKNESWPNADVRGSAQAFQSVASYSFYEFHPEYGPSPEAISIL